MFTDTADKVLREAVTELPDQSRHLQARLGLEREFCEVSLGNQDGIERSFKCAVSGAKLEMIGTSS